MNATIAGLLAIVAVSVGGGWWLSFRKPVEKPVKVMMFVGYFWLLAFVQLLLVAGVYFVWQRF
jgi:hypothetical protein